jgi:hypothetical protein
MTYDDAQSLSLVLLVCFSKVLQLNVVIDETQIILPTSPARE